ncbi:integrator complex subunit 12-like [Hylaeus volcanicus]|uniref:integrator complex subunit 12-like n=1 Tax=Hylaeus volcanicus TaxID=313075 RepID=UPI0023B77C41|nr:integrator complex subunit 12-like [Hylaeus volcanicus]
MFADTEDASDVDRDFYNALALLHSTDDDSADRLRKMLDATIERKCGFDKTLMASMPKKFLQNTKIRGKTFSSGKFENLHCVVSRRTGSASNKSANLTFLVDSAMEKNWNTVQILEAEVEDYTENGDIPRISIPDEGSGDGLVCKVCNGAKLGPLILLECQDCQEVYHPLCHQPPVVDIDVYDPRIVWRCSNCMDTASIDAAVAFDERKPKEFHQHNDESNRKEAFTKMDKLEEADAHSSKNETCIVDQDLLDVFQTTACTEEATVYAKDSPQGNQKTMRTASSNQLKKRIGSKLSVTRAVSKQ